MKSSKKYNKEIVCRNFKNLYLSEWKAHNKTQQEFAEAVNDLMPEGQKNCDNKLVSKWFRGISEPVMYLKAISQVLNVKMDAFLPQNHDARYQYSSDFTDKLEKKLEDIAVENFGLDLSFVQGIRNLVPDFDKRFPLCAPLQFREFDSQGMYFKRPDHAGAAPTTKNYKLLQISRNGKNILLSVFDLKILMEVQKKAIEYICSIFDETVKDLQLKEKQAISKYIEANTNIWETYHFSMEELQEIDPYGLYSDEELNKYHLTRERIKVDEEESEDADT